MNSDHPYHGVRAVLATMHGKEHAIAAPLHQLVGLRIERCPHVDTDALGTFDGEIPRQGTMSEVAIRKARMGMAAANLAIGLASEGTFGPHPQLPFLSAGMELLMLVDDERGFTVSESLIAERTNFGHAVAMRAADVEDFLGRVLFPSHGLIVKSNAPRTIGPLFKGVTDREVLDKAVSTCAEASADGQALIQTDMRAHLNPTRMASLRELAERLAHRLNCLCPACKSPGFGRMDVMRGLPCSACGTPTDMVLAEILGCSACSLTQQRPRRDGLANAGQQFCPLCNP